MYVASALLLMLGLLRMAVLTTGNGATGSECVSTSDCLDYCCAGECHPDPDCDHLTADEFMGWVKCSGNYCLWHDATRTGREFCCTPGERGGCCHDYEYYDGEMWMSTVDCEEDAQCEEADALSSGARGGELAPTGRVKCCSGECQTACEADEKERKPLSPGMIVLIAFGGLSALRPLGDSVWMHLLERQEKKVLKVKPCNQRAECTDSSQTTTVRRILESHLLAAAVKQRLERHQPAAVKPRSKRHLPASLTISTEIMTQSLQE